MLPIVPPATLVCSKTEKRILYAGVGPYKTLTNLSNPGIANHMPAGTGVTVEMFSSAPEKCYAKRRRGSLGSVHILHVLYLR